LYTVRIWNNDSCSVVRPVKITVRTLPSFAAIATTPTLCGSATGEIVASSNAANTTPISYSLNGGAAQNSGTFTAISTGNQTITIQDGFGCESDAVVNVEQTNPTIAQFTANPTSGAVPLSVNFSNSSIFADQFQWFVNGVSQGNTFPNFTATQAGTYTIALVAWQFDPSCADTALLSIFTFDSLVLHLPNVITPNNDQINDFFTLHTNVPLQGSLHITNRWGTTVFTYNGTFPVGQTELWNATSNGKTLSDGTYFYTLNLQADPAFPLAIGENQLPTTREGFIEVRH
jgi:gliding motility-associated-like protein